MVKGDLETRNDKPPPCVFLRWVTWVTLTKTYPTSTSVILLRKKRNCCKLVLLCSIFFEKPLFFDKVVVLVSPYLLVKIAQLSNAMILLTQNSARCYFRVDHHFPPFLVPYRTKYKSLQLSLSNRWSHFIPKAKPPCRRQ